MSDIAAAWARVARLTEACADLRQRLEVVAIERDAAIASDRQASETCADLRRQLLAMTMAQLRAVLDRTGPPAEPAAAKEHYAAEVTALRAQVRALTENGISIHKAVAAERAAIVSFLDRRAADQSVAATAADTDSQRRVKQAQSRRSPAFLRMDAERARLADQGIRSAKLYDLASERAKRTGGDHVP